MAAVLFGFAGFMAFVVPAGRFDVCASGVALVAAGIGVYFVVGADRSRRGAPS